mmetsp:Transcript_38808/g.117260  ORF Transcript_38808/g.117260 Transcript_38808/m.117260 type:complete len:273 (+) Transcript_38808:443-1261(+)
MEISLVFCPFCPSGVEHGFAHQLELVGLPGIVVALRTALGRQVDSAFRHDAALLGRLQLDVRRWGPSGHPQSLRPGFHRSYPRPRCAIARDDRGHFRRVLRTRGRDVAVGRGVGARHYVRARRRHQSKVRLRRFFRDRQSFQGHHSCARDFFGTQVGCQSASLADLEGLHHGGPGDHILSQADRHNLRRNRGGDGVVRAEPVGLLRSRLGRLLREVHYPGVEARHPRTLHQVGVGGAGVSQQLRWDGALGAAVAGTPLPVRFRRLGRGVPGR